MLIAITGCEGDVGSELCKVVQEAGHSIRGIDAVESKQRSTETATFLKADLTNWDEVLEVLKGCDAVITAAGIPNALFHDEHIVHNTNTAITYNVLRACAELGINRVCQLSSQNALGSEFGPFRRQYKYFPLDEKLPCEPADTYALSKYMCEVQADYIVRAFPKMRVASVRPHQCLAEYPVPLSKRTAAPDESKHGNRDELAINACLGYTLNNSCAKGCLLAITSEGWSGHEAFLLVAPDSFEYRLKEDNAMPSAEWAKKHFPNTPVKEGWFDGQENKYRAFWDSSKAERMLGWKHGA